MADVLITGAAGGIGQETARAFAARGFRVISLDLKPLPKELAQAFSPRPVSLIADLTDDASLAEAFAELKELTPALQHLIGLAGGALDGEPQLESAGRLPGIDLFRRSLEANLTSQWNALERALPLLEAGAADGDVSVSFVSSINALTGYGLVGYSAAKAGLIGLMHALCVTLGARGIRVNVLAPGTVPTPRTQEEWAHDTDHFERLAKSNALGRCGTPAQIGDSLCALALVLTHVTGQVLVVDGGQMLKRG